MKIIRSLLLFFVIFAIAGCKDFRIRIDDRIKTFPYKREITVKKQLKKNSLRIKTSLCDFTVRSTDGKEVVMKATVHEKQKDDAEFDFSEKGIRIKSKNKLKTFCSNLEIEIPSETSLRIKTGCGDILVSNIRNSDGIYLNSGAGDINLKDLSDIKYLTAKSGAGNTKAGNCTGISYLKTVLSAGNIGLTGISAKKIYSRVSAGNIIADEIKADSFKARVAVGNILTGDIDCNKPKLFVGIGTIKKYQKKENNPKEQKDNKTSL